MCWSWCGRVGEGMSADEWAKMIAAGEVSPADPRIDLRSIEPVSGDVNETVNGTSVLRELREHER